MILGVDLGLKRVGLAIKLENMVLPLDPIIRKNRNQASNELKKIINERNINTIVFGLPKEGASRDDMKKRVEHFSKMLDFDGKIFFQDEDFSSYEAKEALDGLSKDKKDGKRDSISAKIILERWLCNK